MQFPEIFDICGMLASGYEVVLTSDKGEPVYFKVTGKVSKDEDGRRVATGLVRFRGEKEAAKLTLNPDLSIAPIGKLEPLP